jgi:hypothetical protein
MRLNRSMADASSGNAQATSLFTALGVAVKTADGEIRSVNDALPEIADRFAAITNPAEKTRLAIELFGRSGTRLIPMLSKGAAGLAEMRAELGELGGGLSKEAIEASARYRDSIARLDMAFLSLKSRIAIAILPITSKLTAAFTRLIAWSSKLTDGTSLIEAALVGMSAIAVVALGRVAAAGWAALKPMLPWIAAIALAILIVDELITTWRGGDTIIRRIIDKLWGEGTTQQVVNWVKTVKGEFAQFFDDMRHRPEEFKSNFRAAMEDIKADAKNTFGNVLGKVIGVFVDYSSRNWLFLMDLFSGGMSSAKDKIIAIWETLKLWLTAGFADVKLQILGVVAAVQDAFGGLWNSIISGATAAMATIQKVLAMIPGAGSLADKLGAGIKDLTGAKTTTDGVARIQAQRNELATGTRTQQAQLAPRMLGPMTQNNQASSNVIVNLPATTPSNIAREVGTATGRAVQQSNRAAFNAVSFQPG